MAKQTQNFKNHVRIAKGYHYLTYGLVVAVFAVGLATLFCGHYLMGGTVVLISATLGMIGFYARLFALRAQDRAIRAEENFRHFILAGKPLSAGLRLGQIIALRFASDEEFVELAVRTEKENLKSKEIKQAIKNWRGDYHRV